MEWAASPAFWAIVAVLSVPHWLYAFIWFNPKTFMRINAALTSSHPVDTFAFLGALIKVIQYVAFAGWYWTTAPPVTLSQFGPLRLGVALSLFAVGQVLNMATYKALGKAGVYYGFLLGKSTPWYSGFPFTVISHPQYTGSVLSVWGAGVLLYTPEHCAGGFHAVIALWTLFYLVTGIIEDRFVDRKAIGGSGKPK